MTTWLLMGIAAMGVAGLFYWVRCEPYEQDRLRLLGWSWITILAGEVAYLAWRFFVVPLPF